MDKTPDIKHTMNSLIVENSLYSTPAEKEAFIADKQKVATAFWINLLGMVGMFSFSSNRGLMKTYFQDDKQLRLTTIGDENKDLSLLVKLYTDIGGLPQSAANELTRLLVKMKQKSITSKTFDENVFLEIVSQARIQSARPHPVIFRIVKSYLDGETTLQSAAKEMFFLVKTKKKDFLPLGNEFYTVAKQYVVAMKDVPRVGQHIAQPDADPVDAPHVAPDKALPDGDTKTGGYKQKFKSSDYSVSASKGIDGLWFPTKGLNGKFEPIENSPKFKGYMNAVQWGSLELSKLDTGANIQSISKRQEKLLDVTEPVQTAPVVDAPVQVVPQKDDTKKVVQPAIQKVRKPRKPKTVIDDKKVIDKTVVAAVVDDILNEPPPPASSDFKASDIPAAPDSTMVIMDDVKSPDFDYVPSEAETPYQIYTKVFIQRGSFNIDTFLFGAPKQTTETMTFIEWSVSGALGNNPRNARELDIVLTAFPMKTIVSFLVMLLQEPENGKRVVDAIEGIYERIFAIAWGFEIERFFNLFNYPKGIELFSSWRTSEFFIPLLASFVVKSVKSGNMKPLNDFIKNANTFWKFINEGVSILFNDRKYADAEVLLDFILSSGNVEYHHSQQAFKTNDIDKISKFSDEFRTKFEDKLFTKENLIYGYVTSNFYKELTKKNKWESIVNWLPFKDIETGSKEFDEFVKENVANPSYETLPPVVLVEKRAVVEKYNETIGRIVMSGDNKTAKLNYLLKKYADSMTKSLIEEIVTLSNEVTAEIKAKNPSYGEDGKTGLYYSLGSMLSYEGSFDDLYALAPNEVRVALKEAMYSLRWNPNLYSSDKELNNLILRSTFHSAKAVENSDISDIPSLFTMVLSFDSEGRKALDESSHYSKIFRDTETWNKIFEHYQSLQGDRRSPYNSAVFDYFSKYLDFSKMTPALQSVIIEYNMEENLKYSDVSFNTDVLLSSKVTARGFTELLRNTYSYGVSIPEDKADQVYEAAKRHNRAHLESLAIALPPKAFNRMMEDMMKVFPGAQVVEKFNKIKLDKFNSLCMKQYIELLKDSELPLDTEISQGHMEGIVEYNNIDFSSLYDASAPLPDTVDLSSLKVLDHNIRESNKSPEFIMGETKRLNKFNSRRHGDIGLQVLESHDVHIPVQIDATNFKKESLSEDGIPWNEMEPAFHGCGGVGANMVLKYGFKVIPSGAANYTGAMLGDGIYVTNVLDKAAQYVKTDNPEDSSFSRNPDVHGYLFEMYVVLGKYGVDFLEGGTHSGNDSKPHLVSPEWCLKDHEFQIVIKRVHRVVRKNLKDIEGLNEGTRVKNFKDFLHEKSDSSNNGRKVLTVNFIRDVVTDEMVKQFGSNVKQSSYNQIVIYNDTHEGVANISSIYKYSKDGITKLLSGDISVLKLK